MSRRGASHGLRRRLLFGVGLAALCVTAFAAVVLVRFADDYLTACRDLAGMSRFRQVLDTANGLSAERGPANGVMAEEPSPASSSARRLAEMRGRNDAALARLSDDAEDAEVASRPVAEYLHEVGRRVAEARRAIDGVAALPSRERDAASVQSAIQHMFAASDAFAHVTGAFADGVLDHDEVLKAPVVAAMLLGDLREHAGRIASEIMAPVAVHRAIPEAALVAASRTRGRLLEIWSLIGHRDGIASGGPRVAAERDAVESLFFGDGLALLDHMTEQGEAGGDYDLTAGEFSARFVPTLAPIERLRTVFLDVQLDRLAATRDRAVATLVAVSGCLLTALAVLVGLVVSAQRHVFRPVFVAHEEVIALAEGRVTARRFRCAHGEMQRLFDAIEELRVKVRERAASNAALTRLADADVLTDLVNRRALDRAAESLFGSAQASAGLVLIDLDHFKAINDRHGHPAGDEALRRFARLLASEVPAGCTAARFGGEEFAVLVPSSLLSVAVDLAHRIRGALHARDLSVGSDLTVHLTASFGVAVLPGPGGDWRALIARADAALYRAKALGRDRVCWDGEVRLSA